MKTMEGFVVAALRHVLESSERPGVLPYAAHSLSVCRLVLECEGSQDSACAAILHEAVESGRIGLDEVIERYGKQVGQRLLGMLGAISAADPEVLLLQCADRVDKAVRWHEAGLPTQDLSRLQLLIRKLNPLARQTLTPYLERYVLPPVARPPVAPRRSALRPSARRDRKTR